MTKSVLSRSVLMAGHSMTRAPAFFIVSRTFLPFMPPPWATTRPTSGSGAARSESRSSCSSSGDSCRSRTTMRLGAAEERGARVHLQGAGLVGRRVDADDLDVGLLGRRRATPATARSTRTPSGPVTSTKGGTAGSVMASTLPCGPDSRPAPSPVEVKVMFVLVLAIVLTAVGFVLLRLKDHPRKLSRYAAIPFALAFFLVASASYYRLDAGEAAVTKTFGTVGDEAISATASTSRRRGRTSSASTSATRPSRSTRAGAASRPSRATTRRSPTT